MRRGFPCGDLGSGRTFCDAERSVRAEADSPVILPDILECLEVSAADFEPPIDIPPRITVSQRVLVHSNPRLSNYDPLPLNSTHAVSLR